MAKHSCPYCKCDECSHDAAEKVIWQRSLESLKDYPGSFKPAAKSISHVTRPVVKQVGNITFGESFYVDRQFDIDEDIEDDLGEYNSNIDTTQNQTKKGTTKIGQAQKNAIIELCRKNNQLEEIGGFVYDDGSISLEKNRSPYKKSDSFAYEVPVNKIKNGKKIVGLWHRHLQELNHSPKASSQDIKAANQIGLSSFIVYDVGSNQPKSKFTFDEIHPKIHPNVSCDRDDSEDYFDTSNRHRSNNAKGEKLSKSEGLTNNQKEQLIKVCKEKTKKGSLAVIGGFILPGGVITLEENIAKDDERHFCFNNQRGKATGFWHLHLKSLNMPSKVGEDDKVISDVTGLDCYVIYYDNQRDSYSFDHYYPNGTPNKKPARIYRLDFSCPPIQERIAMARESISRVNGYIREDNEEYRNEVLAVRKEIEKEYQEVQRELMQSAIEMQSAEKGGNQIADILNTKYRLAASGTQEVIQSVFRQSRKQNI